MTRCVAGSSGGSRGVEHISAPGKRISEAMCNEINLDTAVLEAVDQRIVSHSHEQVRVAQPLHAFVHVRYSSQRNLENNK